MNTKKETKQEIKRVGIKEFRAEGFIHEINRQLLHPLGMALEVIIDDETGEEKLGGIWDYRDDPEGMMFGELQQDKIKKVKEYQEKKFPRRKKILGFIIQDRDMTQKEYEELIGKKE